MDTGAPSDWDYRGLSARSYDLWFGGEPFWDQAFFAARIRAQNGTALEVGSGTGRLLLPYLRDGLAVEGVDASEAMLEICRGKARALGLDPVLHHQHMQELALPGRYRTLFVPACSFQILARRDEAMEALRRFREHLQPGGELVIPLFVPWDDLRGGRRWRLRRSGRLPEGDTVLIHEATECDRLEQVQRIWLRLERYRDGALAETELRIHRLRWYHRHEFPWMLEAAGFEGVRMVSGYEGRPANADAEMVFLARRP